MRLFVVTFATGIGLILGMNTFVDVSGFRQRDDMRRLAREQQPGEAITSQVEMDQRAWVKGALERGCPELIVLGSSTSGRLTSEMLGVHDDAFLNAWLTGPSIEDYEAVFVLLQRAGCEGVALVFGVDGFFLNPLERSDRWRTLEAEALAFGQASALERAAVTSVRLWRELKERLSYPVTTASLDWMIDRRWRERSSSLEAVPRSRVCEQPAARTYIRHFDGHYETCPDQRLAQDRVDEVARTYVERDFHSMKRWERLDDERFARLTFVLESLTERGSNAVLFAPPLHPEAYAAVSAHEPAASLLGELDARLSALVGTRYLNLRDPAVLGCDAAEFTDSHHVDVGCARKMGARLARALSARERGSP